MLNRQGIGRKVQIANRVGVLHVSTISLRELAERDSLSISSMRARLTRLALKQAACRKSAVRQYRCETVADGPVVAARTRSGRQGAPA